MVEIGEMNKQEIRDLVKEKRNNAKKQDLEEWNSKIRKNLESLAEYQNSDIIFFYVSFGKEVDTIELIKDLLSRGKKVIIPYYTGSEYSLSYLEDLEDLELGRLGILEPRKNKIKKADMISIDIIIAPGVGFDKKGNRIGYGEGNYDKFMKDSDILKIALCYEFQLFEDIPYGKHDIPMDIIVTEKKTYRIKE